MLGISPLNFEFCPLMYFSLHVHSFFLSQLGPRPPHSPLSLEPFPSLLVALLLRYPLRTLVCALPLNQSFFILPKLAAPAPFPILIFLSLPAAQFFYTTDNTMPVVSQTWLNPPTTSFPPLSEIVSSPASSSPSTLLYASPFVLSGSAALVVVQVRPLLQYILFLHPLFLFCCQHVTTLCKGCGSVTALGNQSPCHPVVCPNRYSLIILPQATSSVNVHPSETVSGSGDSITVTFSPRPGTVPVGTRLSNLFVTAILPVPFSPLPASHLPPTSHPPSLPRTESHSASV